MHFAFQDKDNLYLVLDLLSGGDLRYQLNRNNTFTEDQTSIIFINHYRIFHCMFSSQFGILS